jgi:two-component system NarL family response regulator
MELQEDSAESIRIMIVDDRADVCDGIAALLETDGRLRVICHAKDGVEAVEAFKTKHPDIVLMDLQMPRMGGVEATAKILGESPDTRVIVLTSLGSEAEITRALDAGARCHLFKEECTATLAETIHRVYNERFPMAAGGS